MRKRILQDSRRQGLGRSLFSLATILGLAGGGVFVFSNGIFSKAAFANDLTYQTSVPVEFTFNDYLNITVSGDLVISDLAPGTFADSNHIAVTVNTNNAYGYTLSATVGDTNNSSRDLRHSGYGTGGNTEVFSNLDLDADLTRETFSTGSTYDNKWGFSTDKAGSAYSGKYNGLPLYTNTEDTVVLDTSNYMPTDGTSTTNFWIGAKASSDRVAGTYANVVNFVAVGGVAPLPRTLYNEVVKLSKGKNTSDNGFSWTSITAENSGVYEWAGKTGTDTTATDSNGGSEKVYFYRGILDNTTNTYGSNGLADKYPNYVKLGNDTCWRIVRTTSTGGVKMIYNGVWDTTNNTCANAQTNAQLPTTMPFNTTSKSVTDAVTGGSAKNYTGLQYQNIHAVGYTYSNLAASTSADTPISTIFGASGNDTTTNVNSSIIKQYIEDWYARNMTSYTSKLEGDAGYCNDRTLNTGTTWASALSDSDQIKPYGTSGMTQYYFGAYPRNAQSSTFNPILTCPRGKVDLYSYVSNQGNGNGQLTYPVALLTADEVTLAGSGWSSSTGAYHSNSYLRSGSFFWLLSPNSRGSGGSAGGFYLRSGGDLRGSYVGNAYGVRPSISLNPGTLVAGGTGTATNPWTVE